MMQEMYDWYMDNLFPEHRRQAVKAVEKDSRDRKKRLAQGPRSRNPVQIMTRDEMFRMATSSYRDYSGRSKWERIGKPFMLSQVDWAITLNPFDFAPGHERRRIMALRRNIERYEESTR